MKNKRPIERSTEDSLSYQRSGWFITVNTTLCLALKIIQLYQTRLMKKLNVGAGKF